jgi:hypothetical protein
MGQRLTQTEVRNIIIDSAAPGFDKTMGPRVTQTEIHNRIIHNTFIDSAAPG